MPSRASQPDGRPTVAERSEAELIATIQSHLAPPPAWLLVGIGDDAAVAEPERNRLEVFTVDGIVDGVHVDRRFTPPDAVGYRALAVNLSDLAAMGATPRLALLSLMLPHSLAYDDFEQLVIGLTRLARQHAVHVVGGNLTHTSGPLVVDVTAVGAIKRRDVLTRSGARPGDEVYVSGAVGSASVGLQWLRSVAEDTANEGGAVSRPASQGPTGTAVDGCIARYLNPEPRVRLGVLLARNRAATACVDLSDGLGDGVRRIADASGVGIAINAADIPVAPEARWWYEAAGLDPVASAVAAGDDYELLFTVQPRSRGRLRAVARHCGTTMTRIGVCTKESTVVLRRVRDGVASEEPLPQGYHHFG